jgi:hypothetical protein
MRVTGDDTTFTAESDVDVDFSVNDLAGADRGLSPSRPGGLRFSDAGDDREAPALMTAAVDALLGIRL